MITKKTVSMMAAAFRGAFNSRYAREIAAGKLDALAEPASFGDDIHDCTHAYFDLSTSTEDEAIADAIALCLSKGTSYNKIADAYAAALPAGFVAVYRQFYSC